MNETDEIEKLHKKMNINSMYGSYGSYRDTIPTSAAIAMAVHRAGLYAEIQTIKKHKPLSEEDKERITELKNEVKHHELYYPEYYL